ncbi:hypothetical protein AMTR_s00005p00249910 [Amborella trichopoda]|uniref:Uncharacterized protein n=1 Tax=Amborella trichopoda TaxID=13333 RepID=W1PIE3_AMBTC|nr:hypothetical protein AMTR_s00005p00249910 [Amborella trichopoda]
MAILRFAGMIVVVMMALASTLAVAHDEMGPSPHMHHPDSGAEHPPLGLTILSALLFLSFSSLFWA